MKRKMRPVVYHLDGEFGMNEKIILAIIGILSIVTFFLAGCTGNSSSPRIQYIRGWVNCDTQDVEAEIYVYDAENNLLNMSDPMESFPVQTSSMGSFVVAVKDIPDTIWVVAENISCSDDRVGEFKADIRNYEPEQSIIHLNPVTTLLTKYIERFPSIDYDQAKEEVRGFLKIPETVDLALAPYLSETYFSLEAFLWEADDYGGVEFLLKSLLEELWADPLATHPFILIGVNVGGASSLIKNIGGKLINGALSYIGGQGLGWILDKIGLGFPDATAEAIEQMQKDLQDIKNTLENLKVALNKISMEITQSNYDIRVGQLIPLISLINTTTEDLYHLASIINDEKYHEKYGEWIENEKERVQKVIGQQLLNQLDIFHLQQVGEFGQDGLLKVWSRIIAKHQRFLGPEDSRNMHIQFEYFDMLQLALFNLALEYHHTTGAPEFILKNLVDKYENNKKTQEAMVPRMIPDKAVVETANGLMISTETIWDDAARIIGIHFACNLPKHNGTEYFIGMGWSSQFKCVFPQTSASPPGDFHNWRMATLEEALAMFDGWKASGTSPAKWAVSQGYPEGFLIESAVIFLTNRPFFYKRNSDVDTTRIPYIFNLKSGATVDVKCTYQTATPAKNWSCFSPEYIYAPSGYLVPVRKPPADEIYFY